MGRVNVEIHLEAQSGRIVQMGAGKSKYILKPKAAGSSRKEPAAFFRRRKSAQPQTGCMLAILARQLQYRP
jgi:hypothetical protein